MAILFLLIILSAHAPAAVIDEVVAFVEDEAITSVELDSAYEDTLLINPSITREEVLSTMINRAVLLREARALRLSSDTEEGLLKEYIDLKVRAFIKISDEDVRTFYESNRGEFGDIRLQDIKDRIISYLEEKELNEKLKAHISELKSRLYIKVLAGRRK